MNNSITRITLDVSVQAKQACISLRQFDTMRRIVFSIVDRGVPYVFEKGVYAYLSAKTSAETYVFGGTTIQDGAVHFDVPASMTLEEGEIQCELILSAADNQILNTSSFDIIVFHSNGADYADDAIASDDFFAMVEATNGANDIARILKEKLENGEFKGEKGEKGDPGIGLPEVTEADNDKILMVINGEWEMVYLDNVTPPTTDPVPTPSGYTPIKILSFSNGIIGAREYGDSISEVTLAWSLSKSAKTIKIDGTQLDASATSHKISGLNITKDSSKTWQLEVTDERDYKATKTTAPFTFANGVYYGAAAEPAQYDSAFILGLEKVLQNGKVTSISVNAAEDKYIYYALPARYGECSFTVGTFTGGFELVETIEFTNAHGYTEAYNVYRSDYPGLGQTTVKVS
jgi:hypothetical protein